MATNKPYTNSSEPRKQVLPPVKILYIDIETFPNVGYTWGKWQQDVIAFKEDGYILCFAYRWDHEPKTKVVAINDFTKYRPHTTRDEKIIHVLWRLLDEADVVIAQNGDAFDIPKIKTRFVQHNLTPPSPYKTIDTLKIARQFAFNSNKLDDLGNALNEGRKVQHEGFPLWLGCHDGNPESWRKMKEYNINDVDLLMKIYKRLQPWTTKGVNMGVYEGRPVCPKCSGVRLQLRGFTVTNARKYRRYHCQDCGGWSRATKCERGMEVLTHVS